MVKKVFLISILVLMTNDVVCQFQVTGTVIGSDDTLPLPSVTIIELGTENTVSSDSNGKFKINITNDQAVLEFRFLGYVTRKIPVDGNHEVNTFLKPYALMHFWRRQKIKLYLNSGILETPVGGELSISSPKVFGSLILESSFRYQSNLGERAFSNFRVSLLQVIHTGYFNLDINFNRSFLSLQDEFSYLIKSFEFDIYIHGNSRFFWNFKPTIGFDEINYSQVNDNIEDRISRGITVGYRKGISSLDLELYPKVTFFKDLTRYSLKVNRYFGQTELYLQFQKTGHFTELNVGIGWKLTYQTRKQKNINTYKFD